MPRKSTGPAKPTVILDCDGVLADFVSGTLREVAHLTQECFDPSIVTTWEVFDSLPKEVQWAKTEVYDRLKGRGGCLSLPPCPGAQEGVEALREFAKIVVVTTPFSGSRHWTSEREMWLQLYFQIPKEDVIFAYRKDLIHADVFVDDKPEHVKAWREYWGSSMGFVWSTDRCRDDPNLTNSWAYLLDTVRIAEGKTGVWAPGP